MELKVYPGYTALSDAIADATIELIKAKPNAVICFASGNTPRLTCQLLVQKAKSQQVDTGKIVFIGLDEWVGIPPSNEGSCHYFFQHEVFEPLNLSPAQRHLFDAMSNNLDNECRKMDAVIAANGDIDLMIVGIGILALMNPVSPSTIILTSSTWMKRH